MVQVSAFVPYPTERVPGQRFRIEQWASRLEEEGVAVAFLPFLSNRGMEVLHEPGHILTKILETLAGLRRRISHLQQLESCDVAFLFREAALLGPPLVERALARKRPVVFDFDDAIYLPPANPANPSVSCLRGSAKTATLCGLASHVTVGNAHLAAYARSRASIVSVVPTTIDTSTYVPRDRVPNSRPVVGWSGSISTVPYLATLRESLLALRREVSFDLRVIGGELSWPTPDIECLPWSVATEVDDLRPIDVGLMPLPDDPWAQGKCGLKALQYMALAIPPVVSPVGVNREIVQDGENGFHASSDGEWITRVKLLLTNAGLRKRMGRAARRTVEDHYSADTWAPRVAAILRGVASPQ